MDVVLARSFRGRAGAPRGVPGGRAARPHRVVAALSEAPAGLSPFIVLGRGEGHTVPIPAELAAVYGGDLGLPARGVYANFVQSVDGVVAMPGVDSAGSLISGKNRADRFVMALLRAAADCVLMGAGTMRATPGHEWTAAHVFPELAGAFAAMREALGKPPQPRLVVLTRSGDIDEKHPAVRAGATFLTTPEGARRLQPILPPSSAAVVLGDTGVEPADAVRWIHEQGWNQVLSEAGPHVMAQLVAAGLVADVFITISPLIAGRSEARPAFALLEGVALLPEQRVQARLAEARRHGDFLFLRYSL